MPIVQYGSSGGSSVPDKIVLDYAAADDLMVGVALAAEDVVDVCPNQTFTVDAGARFIECRVSGIVRVGGVNAGGIVLSQLILDSESVPIVPRVSSVPGPEVPADYVNALSGACGVALSDFDAGEHTIKVVAQSTVANTAYCQPISESPWEWLRIQVIERF